VVGEEAHERLEQDERRRPDHGQPDGQVQQIVDKPAFGLPGDHLHERKCRKEGACMNPLACDPEPVDGGVQAVRLTGEQPELQQEVEVQDQEQGRRHDVEAKHGQRDTGERQRHAASAQQLLVRRGTDGDGEIEAGGQESEVGGACFRGGPGDVRSELCQAV
jgi:hypothetical protein